MEREEAIRKLICRMKIKSRLVYTASDPAHSTMDFTPDEGDLTLVSAIIGREVTQTQLRFNAGSVGMGTHYTLVADFFPEFFC